MDKNEEKEFINSQEDTEKKTLIKSVSNLLLETSKVLQSGGGKVACIIGGLAGIVGTALAYWCGL